MAIDSAAWIWREPMLRRRPADTAASLQVGGMALRERSVCGNAGHLGLMTPRSRQRAFCTLHCLHEGVLLVRLAPLLRMPQRYTFILLHGGSSARLCCGRNADRNRKRHEQPPCAVL